VDTKTLDTPEFDLKMYLAALDRIQDLESCFNGLHELYIESCAEVNSLLSDNNLLRERIAELEAEVVDLEEEKNVLRAERDRLKEDVKLLELYLKNTRQDKEQLRARHAALVEVASEARKYFLDRNLGLPAENIEAKLKAALAEVKG
jgi:chromosome segregation ATPase